MATKFRWAPGLGGVRELPGVLGALNAFAMKKANQGGDGYHVKAAPQSSAGRGRGRAAVVTDARGARKEAKNHTLARG